MQRLDPPPRGERRHRHRRRLKPREDCALEPRPTAARRARRQPQHRQDHALQPPHRRQRPRRQLPRHHRRAHRRPPPRRREPDRRPRHPRHLQPRRPQPRRADRHRRDPRPPRQPRPDLVVVVADAQNLERNLYFAAQVIELGRPTLIALNMVDAAKKAGITIDAPALARALGVPVVPVVATRPDTLGALRDAITAALAAPPAPGGWRWTPDATLQADLDALLPVLGDAAPTDATPDLRRAVALWALMSIDESDELTDAPAELRLRVLDRLRDARVAGRDIDGAVIAARYAWIDAHAADWITRAEVPTSWTERVDRVLLNPVAGFFVFLAIMFTVFQALFAWSDPLIGLVEDAFGWLGERVPALLGEGIAADFVKDALIGGVGNVLVFLPQIVLLFIFVAIMEDSGYMARAAFLMDRVMNRIGLHGRAFVPMLSAYACAVPAIMATRTMERRRDRYLTMMVLPLTTCSARLPVYALIIGAIIPAHYVAGVFNTQSLVMGAMYLFGIAMALVAAAVLGRTVLRGPRVPLLMELPPYRMPDPRASPGSCSRGPRSSCARPAR
ncbi:MAG: ferrous iron transport protein B [Myxococcales bacterium]|nr:ferrous iron transport protein B [Myxococcales bacterium]